MKHVILSRNCYFHPVVYMLSYEENCQSGHKYGGGHSDVTSLQPMNSYEEDKSD